MKHQLLGSTLTMSGSVATTVKTLVTKIIPALWLMFGVSVVVPESHAEEITWTFTGVISSTSRPDVGDLGDLMEMQFSMDEDAMNLHPDPEKVFRAEDMQSVSASINGQSVFGNLVLGSSTSIAVANVTDVGIDTINWLALDSSGVNIRAFFRLPTFVLPLSPTLQATLQNNMIALAGPGDSSLTVCLTPIGDCISAVPISTYQFAATPSVDTDGDGTPDALDNCVVIENPGQQDSDGDGFGNACDADLDGDCVVTFLDLSEFAQVFLTNDSDADFNQDGAVNFLDLNILTQYFTQQPGPSALADCN